MTRWQWHQLDHMQIICTSVQINNHISTLPLNFLQAGCPSCRPTNSVKALIATTLAYNTHTHNNNRFTALSGTTGVSQYQKKHSPTHNPDHHPTCIQSVLKADCWFRFSFCEFLGFSILNVFSVFAWTILFLHCLLSLS